MAALAAVRVLMELQELDRSLIRFRVPAVAAVAVMGSPVAMVLTEVPAAAAVHHLARVTNQPEARAFPVKAALVVAAISGITQATQDAAAAAAVLVVQETMQVGLARLQTEERAATARPIQSAVAA